MSEKEATPLNTTDASPDEVLIVEDDPNITEILSLYLTGAGYEVHTACNGREGLDTLQKNRISAVLVDIMMPVISGYDFIREARIFSDVPILVISARTQAADKMLGLNLGADGYVTKPFDPVEVIAYVQAVLRRYRYSQTTTSSIPMQDDKKVIAVRDLIFDSEKLVLRKKDEIIPLTATELKIMMRFMRAPGRIFTKTQLYETVTGETFGSADESVMVHISNIRAKLGDTGTNAPYIKTVRGLGYRLEA